MLAATWTIMHAGEQATACRTPSRVADAVNASLLLLLSSIVMHLLGFTADA